MSFFGAIQNVTAKAITASNQTAITAEKSNTNHCNMCQTALKVWEENAIASEKILTQIPEPQLFTTLVPLTSVLITKLAIDLYPSYYPPPQAALKAVTPNTKTIVLLS